MAASRFSILEHPKLSTIRHPEPPRCTQDCVCLRNAAQRNLEVRCRESYKIAFIEGDGIGCEGVPEGLRVLEAAGRRYDLESEDRPEDAGGWPGPVTRFRCHLPWRCRISPVSRTYFAVGFVDPNSARVSAVRRP